MDGICTSRMLDRITDRLLRGQRLLYLTMQAPLTITTSRRRRISFSASPSSTARSTGYQCKTCGTSASTEHINLPTQPAYDGFIACEAHSRRTLPFRDTNCGGRLVDPLERPRDGCSIPVPGRTESGAAPISFRNSPAAKHFESIRNTRVFGHL